MKIRNGFVSNSSSSSFILKLPHFPTSYEDMKRILLGDKDPLVLTYDYDHAFPTQQVIDIIYNDVIEALKSQGTNSVDSINGDEVSISEYSLDEYDNRITPGNRDEYNTLKRQYKMIRSDLKNAYKLKDSEERNGIINGLYEQEDQIGNKMGDLVLKSIKEKSLDTDLFVTLSYSDNNGSLMSFIEHGDILDPITTIKISHH